MPEGGAYLESMRWEEIDHTADVGIRVEAASREELFSGACRAMFELMYGPQDDPAPTRKRSVEVSGDSDTDLLWEFLSEALGWAEVDRAAYYQADVVLGDRSLRADLSGPSIDDLELAGPPIKAVTYHGLEVKQTESNWTATVIFDV
jgi:SHS2 domain-containing protein